MKKFIVCAVAITSLGFVNSASAADMPTKAPIAAMTAPVYNWTGWYVGGFVGGAGSSGHASATELPVSTGGGYNGIGTNWDWKPSGSVIGGGTIGYNFQFASKWLVGIEGEFGYLRVKGSAAFPRSLDTSGSSEVGDWYGVIAGRLGLTWDRVLVYAKGGAAFVRERTSVIDACVAAPCGPAYVNASGGDTRATWALGGGLEYGWTRNWTVKAEYLYLATNHTYLTSGPGGIGAAPPSFVGNWNVSVPATHTAKIGVNYRF